MNRPSFHIDGRVFFKIRFSNAPAAAIAWLCLAVGSCQAAATVTFTTKDGQTYVSKSVQATDNGLVVLTSDGGATVSYDLLPDDISMFQPDIQKAIRQHRNQAIAGFSFQRKLPLDVACHDFIEKQVAAWQPLYPAQQHLPASVTLLANTVPVVQSLKHRESGTFEVTPLAQGSTVQPLAMASGCFVVPIAATESYEEITDVSHTMDLSYNAHFERHTDTIRGTGLIHLQDTSFPTEVHDQIQKDLLEGKISLAHLVLNAPAKFPLYNAGELAGYETLESGAAICVKECMADSVVAFPEGQTDTATIPKASTDWDEETALLANAIKFQGFLDRLNQLIGKAGLTARYDAQAQKRFAITDQAGESWKFNPEDLSADPPRIYDQSMTQDTDESLVYSRMAVIGYADENRVAVAGARTDAAAASHTHTTVSVYFVTVEAQPNATLETTVPGEVQKHKLIFRILDKAEAGELAELFSDFCHTFGASPNPGISPPPNWTENTNAGTDAEKGVKK
jgi:uncharacterized protein (DUF2249 family)